MNHDNHTTGQYSHPGHENKARRFFFLDCCYICSVLVSSIILPSLGIDVSILEADYYSQYMRFA